MHLFLESLIADDRSDLSRADYVKVAAELGCEVAAIRAVAHVESGTLGAFASDGRPVILYEPHVFSKRTAHIYDADYPDLSYPVWKTHPYPKGQAARWTQVDRAYGLSPEDAVASTSWGRFQMMGFNHAMCGFDRPTKLVVDLARSQARQLAAFVDFVDARHLADELKNHDWEGFALRYNGAGNVTKYALAMAAAYAKFKLQD